ncbi:MAG: ABC transporter permease [Actinobacteria bacterium]|nr:ABC transporter permease [Actinomycetota bacterium]
MHEAYGRAVRPTPVVVPGHRRPGEGRVRRKETAVTPRVRHVAAPTLLGLVLLAAWLLLSKGLPAYVLPNPGSVVVKLWRGLTTRALLAPLGVTLVEAAAGCLAGAAVALPLAILLHRSRWADSATRPFLGATQAIPAIALAPLLVLWVGYGLVPIALLCALIVFFPILVAAASGLRHVDHEVVDAARMDGASSVQRLLHIELPLSLPWIYAGLRNGFTLSVTGAVVGEMVMGGAGLGTVLVVQRDQLDTAGMVATIVLLAVVASVAYLALVALERRSATVSSLVRES